MAVDTYTPLLVTCYRVRRASTCAKRMSRTLRRFAGEQPFLSFPHSQGAASHTLPRLLVFCASNIAGVNTNNSFDRKNSRGTHTEERAYRILFCRFSWNFCADLAGYRRNPVFLALFSPLLCLSFRCSACPL